MSSNIECYKTVPNELVTKMLNKSDDVVSHVTYLIAIMIQK